MHVQGKRGACIGCFQLIVGRHEDAESLGEVIALLRDSDHKEVPSIVRVIQRWAKDEHIQL